MCGRFTITVSASELAELLGVERIPEVRPRYNIAPSQPVLAARPSNSGTREAAMLNWGLIPSWATDPKIASALKLARAETVAQKPSFRSAYKHRRCIIAADGFFEWTTIGKAKYPHWFHRQDRRPFVFAGLWERWSPENGDAIETCCIVTTEANAVVKPYNERMPVILEGSAVDRWLKPGDISPEVSAALFKPAPESFLTEYEVSTAVNSSRVNGPECIEPVGKNG
jgi:putative SOS response-associated peptidase YedK